MKSYLEIFIVTLATGDAIRYAKKRLEITTVNRDPDDLVHELIKGTSGAPPLVRQDRCIVHSTSWRYEGKEGIVLTYLVYSDEVNFQEEETKWLRIKDMRIVQSKNPSKPRPQSLQEGDILLHGIRHLSFLISSAKNERLTLLLDLKTQLMFKNLPFEMAGKINLI
jgi:hypothetical protein